MKDTISKHLAVIQAVETQQMFSKFLNLYRFVFHVFISNEDYKSVVYQSNMYTSPKVLVSVLL